MYPSAPKLTLATVGQMGSRRYPKCMSSALLIVDLILNKRSWLTALHATK